MTRGPELRSFKTTRRGNTQIAVSDVVIGGWLIIRSVEVHWKDGVAFMREPRAINGPTPKIASGFRVALLTKVGFDFPSVLQSGRAPAPLFDMLNDNDRR